jgi:rhodanese-related sulfurtransferase
MKRLLILILIGFTISCSNKNEFDNADEMVNIALKNVTLISPDSLEVLMKGEEIYTLIDVRQEIEHYYGYIPGSVVIPRGSLEFSIGNEEFWEQVGLYMPEKTEKIIVYCHKGQRGILAAETLTKLGYKNAFALDGGWKAWEVTFPDNFEKDLEKLGGGNSSAPTGGC